jgi:hypothetical protein
VQASLTIPPEADLVSGDNPVYIGDMNAGESTTVWWRLVFTASGVFNLDINSSAYKQNTGEYVEKHGSATVTVTKMITILSPKNTTYAIDSVPLTFTVIEPTSWMGYSLDGQANVAIAGNTTLIGLSDGPHCVVVYANDTYGHMELDEVYFTVDTTPPAISILCPQDTTYPTSGVSLNFMVNETTDWIGYSLDRQGNRTIPGNTTLIDLSDGSHCVEVYANDTSGNMGSDKICFTVDTTPPEASFSYSPETPIVDEDLCFNASASYDPEGQVVSFEWDFGDGTTGTGVIAYHTYTELGNYTVALTIKNKAGNTGTKTMTIIVQEQPPIFPTWISVVVVLVAVAIGVLLIYFLKAKKAT